MALPVSGPLSLNDIQTEFGGTNPIGMNEYYAGGGLVPAGTSGTYGAVPSSGTISIQNFYGTSNFVPVYVENVFQTWLYTGNGGLQTINNGIDLSGNGGLIWIKSRSVSVDNILVDTTRGPNSIQYSNSASAAFSSPSFNAAFSSTGYSFNNGFTFFNNSGDTYASWTFRKQPKFFDVVTYTGDGVLGRTVAHNLGSVPGCIIVKSTDSSANWAVYHRSTGNTSALQLNLPNAPTTNYLFWNNTDPTSTVFTVGLASSVNSAGVTYVAYLFAHDAGGFGLTGTDSVISCGSFTGSSSTVSITLGWEPQWLLVKCSGGSGGNWILMDNIRGLGVNGGPYLYPNQNVAEYGQFTPSWSINATGFTVAPSVDINRPGEQSIYIAIRRGPMKTPTTGTSVFAPIAATPSAGSAATTGFPVDMSMMSDLTGASYVGVTNDRLRSYATSNTSGNYWNLFTTYTWSETTFNPGNPFVYGADNNTGLKWGNNAAGLSDVLWAFRRAPGFFDVVCYTGVSNSAPITINHNLGVQPELVIVKSRIYNTDDNSRWNVGSKYLSAGQPTLVLNNDEEANVSMFLDAAWNSAATSTTLTLSSNLNLASFPYVAYMFATLAGVSKVGTYTGTGALQTINCGFTGGARFVLIKRTNSTGDWYVYDSARGISSGNDPYVRLNTTAAQVASTNYVDTASVGFQVTAAAPAGLNANGGTYLFLAIA